MSESPSPGRAGPQKTRAKVEGKRLQSERRNMGVSRIQVTVNGRLPPAYFLSLFLVMNVELVVAG